MSTDEGDESLVRYEEEWATEEAMRLHVRSERFTQFLEVLESVPEAPRVQFDFVSETRGLDYVEEVRRNDGSLGTRFRRVVASHSTGGRFSAK